MNKKFFIHQITVYHFKDDESVSKIHFKQVYFRHTKKLIKLIKVFKQLVQEQFTYLQRKI